MTASVSQYSLSLPHDGGLHEPQSSPLNFFRAVTERNAGRLDRIPVAGSRSLRFAKLAGERAMSAPDVVTIIATSPDDHALDYIRALVVDSGKDESIVVKLAVTPRAANLAEGELTFCEVSARFVAQIERKRTCGSLDRKELRDLEIGLEARARAVMQACEQDQI